MNYLAHFHLAWPDDALLAGALEGDYFKGLLPGALPDVLHPGVDLHRAIDGFTDRHPTLDGLRAAFPDGTRRYAGILFDLGFDYLLSRHWERFAEVELSHFSQRVYRVLDAYSDTLSHPARRMAGRLAQYDLLMQYRHWDTVISAASRIGERMRKPNPLHRADSLLKPLLPELEQAFLVFYPELQEFCRQHAARNKE